MNRSEPHDEEDRPVPPRGAMARGIVTAIVADMLVTAPGLWAIARIRPENLSEAVSKLFLALNMVVGYVGGRFAVRGGLSHEDSRSQWTMASVVSAVSLVTSQLLIPWLLVSTHLVRIPTTSAQAPQHASQWPQLIEIAAMFLLIRFGFAMGTHAQAKRDGRVQDEDEASAE